MTLLMIMVYTAIAGACIPLGGKLAQLDTLQSQWLEKELRHFIIALGGGVLLGAVALVLVPEGLALLNYHFSGVFWVLAGGICFFFIERLMGLRRREAPQLMGLLLDYVPETLALGGMIAVHAETALLLGILIGLQNIPEGFNAYREILDQGKRSPKQIIQFMQLLVLIGPFSGIIGYLFLSTHLPLLGAILLFASGGILYLLFQDIAPQSRLNKHWAPPLGAVFGFSFALLSYLLQHS